MAHMNHSTSLQIPQVEPERGSSRQQTSYNMPPQPSSASAYRPASVAVHSASPSSPNTYTAPGSSRRQQRASHSVVSPSSNAQDHSNGNSRSEPSPYPDVYSHQAAVAYAAAHPRRTIPKFGPYLLLQTLGEGEFGKVKLGLHCQWGEEVAVKLIRRGNVDSTVRMSKVEREIEVLRTLKHPNIVRLYDVIETDKYIGIILEYASGGELFDHILAHRYLREKDAAKLFSQLISGVWYIHQKKIVHRDLKLENLLLDRHRNVIITDFGFANRFEHRSDDLMQTSCGSPCYAAPELVISEGLYVGSAVDIWSCGVILYAMLAGYLPFDDDPANPDGDNINLLYKYIVNTPLSFPEYVSAEARDLLSLMLVPDPTRRATLDTVMRHSWLSEYQGTSRTDGVPAAFGKAVVDLEKAAMEQHHQKRLAYQKQMKANANAIVPSPRSQSHRTEPSAAPSSSGRSRSTQPEYLYDSSLDQSASAPVPNTAVQTTPKQNGSTAKTFESPVALGLSDDDPFAAPASAKTNSVVVTTTTTTSTSKQRTSEDSGRQPATATLAPAEPKSPSSKGHRSSTSGGGGFRHTIQVEYDEPSSKGGRRAEDKGRSRSGSQGQTQPTQSQLPSQQQNGYVPPQSAQAPPKERRPSQGNAKPLPPSPLPIVAPSAYRGPAAPVTPKSPSNPHSNNATPTKASASSTPRSTNNAASSPVAETPNISISSPPQTPSFPPIPQPKDKDKDTSSQNSNSSLKQRSHKKGKSSIDKLGLGKIFGGGSSSSVPPVPSLSGSQQHLPSPNGDSPARVPSEGQGSTSSVGQGSSSEKEQPHKEKEGWKSRRNTLTVMVEPFIGTIRGRKARMTATPATPDGASAANGAGNKASQKSMNASSSTSSVRQPPQSAFLPSTNNAMTPIHAMHASTAAPGSAESAVFVGSHDLSADVAGMQASTNKARKVMQWFRTKSKGRESVSVNGGGSELEDEKEGTPTQTKYKKGFSASSNTVNQVMSATVGGMGLNESMMSPQVVVTQPTSATPRTTKVSTSGHPGRAATTTNESWTPSLVSRFRNSVTVGGLSSHHSSSHTSSSKSGGHPHGQLRIHHGAVDQTTITTKPPPEVMAHIKQVLEGMGVEIQFESEYKYRCIRAKKRKGTMGAGASAGSAGSGSTPANLAAVQVVGSAASNGVDKRGLPLPSPSAFSATGGMLRGLLMRRQSSQVSATSQPSFAFDDETSVVVSEPLLMNDTAYGDPSQDAGDEVRFSVELTRIDRLNDTYSLDIRRLKGNLRSYKYLYDSIRERADLQR